MNENLATRLTAELSFIPPERQKKISFLQWNDTEIPTTSGEASCSGGVDQHEMKSQGFSVCV